MTGLQLYTGTNEVGQVADLFGYGATGTGVTGDTNPNTANLMHYGLNIFQSLGTPLGYSNTMLAMDLNDGTDQDDALYVEYGIPDIGPNLGNAQAIPGHGDSGGPWLVGVNPNVPGSGEIAGVVSFGYGVPGVMVGTTPMPPPTARSPSPPASPPSAGWINSVVGGGLLAPQEFLVNADDALSVATTTASVRPDLQLHRQRGRQPVPLVGGDGRRRRLRHHLDLDWPGRSQRRR